ncbi:hypothetical protein CN893_21900 [Bacillus thuringiensis]|nr:hypothetical protein CN893_21900 [Bacillus thuringiensis]
MPSFDLNHLNFNNMYWTPVQLLFYHVKLFYLLRNTIIYLCWPSVLVHFVVHAAINKRTIVVKMLMSIFIKLRIGRKADIYFSTYLNVILVLIIYIKKLNRL